MGKISAVSKYLVCICALAFFLPQAGAVDLGGNIEVRSGISYQEELKAQLGGTSEVEFFLPDAGDLDTRLVIQAHLAEEKGAAIGVKYMYLRHRFDSGHITMGRQPVSWSYGSMIHPLDYRMSVEDFAGESVTPSVDGIRAVGFFGERASLQAAAGFPGDLQGVPLDSLGYGARLRIPVPGHDISVQFSSQPMDVLDENLFRGGATYSGDLGPVGIYGAFGYSRLLETEVYDFIAQLGMDYSWNIGPEYERRKVYFQAEYLRFLREEMELPLIMMLSGEGLGGNGSSSPRDLPEFYDLIAAHMSVDMNQFTQIGAAAAATTGDWFLGVTPYMQSELANGLDLRIEGMLNYFSDSEELQTGANVSLRFYF